MPAESKHLISPLPKNTPIGNGHQLLKDAHDYLVRLAQPALESWSSVPPDAHWGRQIKRRIVEFKSNDRPELISKHLKEHSLAEVVNQTATIERLLDVLRWANSGPSRLRGLTTIVRCHPTTSSQKDDESGDNDLILGGDSSLRACFEVSDVVGTNDSNGKLLKDLISLGALKKGEGKTKLEVSWPKERLLFLVVSPQLAANLVSRKSVWITEGHCHYDQEVLGDTDTKLFEIKKGSKVSPTSSSPVSDPGGRPANK